MFDHWPTAILSTTTKLIKTDKQENNMIDIDSEAT